MIGVGMIRVFLGRHSRSFFFFFFSLQKEGNGYDMTGGFLFSCCSRFAFCFSIIRAYMSPAFKCNCGNTGCYITHGFYYFKWSEFGNGFFGKRAKFLSTEFRKFAEESAVT